jgi:NADH:ubiquinone oxidoreductase subunit 3 (subunit A)
MKMLIVITVFTVMSILFVSGTLFLSSLLQTRRPTPEKLTTYECGPPPFGEAWRQMNLHYYIFALLFVLFDVEAVFLYPVALAARAVGWWAFGEVVVFIAILLAGYVYAWRAGGLEWER